MRWTWEEWKYFKHTKRNTHKYSKSHYSQKFCPWKTSHHSVSQSPSGNIILGDITLGMVSGTKWEFKVSGQKIIYPTHNTTKRQYPHFSERFSTFGVGILRRGKSTQLNADLELDSECAYNLKSYLTVLKMKLIVLPCQIITWKPGQFVVVVVVFILLATKRKKNTKMLSIVILYEKRP